MLAINHSPNPLLPEGQLGQYVQAGAVVGMLLLTLLLPLRFGASPCADAAGTEGCALPGSSAAGTAAAAGCHRTSDQCDLKV